MKKQDAIEKIRKLCDPNTTIVNYETNPLLSSIGYYNLSTCTNEMSDKDILEVIKLCREHSINFNFYDGLIRWAHQESMNFF